eukprot:11127-Heterococcus_DN1.PRE.2
MQLPSAVRHPHLESLHDSVDRLLKRLRKASTDDECSEILMRYMDRNKLEELRSKFLIWAQVMLQHFRANQEQALKALIPVKTEPVPEKAKKAKRRHAVEEPDSKSDRDDSGGRKKQKSDAKSKVKAKQATAAAAATYDDVEEQHAAEQQPDAAVPEPTTTATAKRGAALTVTKRRRGEVAVAASIASAAQGEPRSTRTTPLTVNQRILMQHGAGVCTTAVHSDSRKRKRTGSAKDTTERAATYMGRVLSNRGDGTYDVLLDDGSEVRMVRRAQLETVTDDHAETESSADEQDSGSIGGITDDAKDGDYTGKGGTPTRA